MRCLVGAYMEASLRASELSFWKIPNGRQFEAGKGLEEFIGWSS